MKGPILIKNIVAIGGGALGLAAFVAVLAGFGVPMPVRVGVVTIATAVAYWRLRARRAAGGGPMMTRRELAVVRVTDVVFSILAGTVAFAVTAVVIRWAGGDQSTLAAVVITPLVMFAFVAGGGRLVGPWLTEWALRRWGSR